MLLFVIPALAVNVQRNPTAVYDVKHDVSLPLSVMAKNAPAPKPGMIEMREHRSPKHFFSISNEPDTAMQTETLPDVQTINLLNFDAITGAQGGAIPPDTNGSVGSTQYVLITNFDYAVYDKATGNTILAPTRINVIWSGFGGQCQTNNGGDPIVLWDKLAQRWLVEQLEYFGGPNLVCVAVSTSADATGSYNRYSFAFGSALPDYPHISVWPDAYYLAVNSFGNGWGQPCALDRIAMLAGSTAKMVCFSPNSSNFGFLPSDVDGTTAPPAGAPAHFLEMGNNNTSLNYFDFHVDFVNNNSTFTGPHTITVPAYTVLCGGGGGACVHQPSPGSLLDALGDRLMYRNAYRNFGDHEAMVVAHSVRPTGGSTADAATRWYELRATPPGSAFTLYQVGGLQDKKISVWMASVAMDKMGNMALGASAVSSTTTKPTIGYTGRVASDPLGKLESPKLVAKGTGVQTGTNRWGDYSSLSVDSSDDCTFWYAQEYYKVNGTNWITHINSFKFINCN